MVKREELGAAIVGAAIGVAITYASVAWSDWFASSRYSNAASNLLGIVGGPLLIASIAMGGWRWWNTRCAVRSCLRTGEHPVTDCTVKVCSRHHTRDQHIAVATLHHVEGFLGWGESHHTPPRETRRGQVEPLATAFVRIRPTTDEVLVVARAGARLAADVQAALERFIAALSVPELPEGDR